MICLFILEEELHVNVSSIARMFLYCFFFVSQAMQFNKLLNAGKIGVVDFEYNLFLQHWVILLAAAAASFTLDDVPVGLAAGFLASIRISVIMFLRYLGQLWVFNEASSEQLVDYFRTIPASLIKGKLHNSTYTPIDSTCDLSVVLEGGDLDGLGFQVVAKPTLDAIDMGEVTELVMTSIAIHLLFEINKVKNEIALSDYFSKIFGHRDDPLWVLKASWFPTYGIHENVAMNAQQNDQNIATYLFSLIQSFLSRQITGKENPYQRLNLPQLLLMSEFLDAVGKAYDSISLECPAPSGVPFVTSDTNPTTDQPMLCGTKRYNIGLQVKSDSIVPSLDFVRQQFMDLRYSLHYLLLFWSVCLFEKLQKKQRKEDSVSDLEVLQSKYSGRDIPSNEILSFVEEQLKGTNQCTTKFDLDGLIDPVFFCLPQKPISHKQNPKKVFDLSTLVEFGMSPGAYKNAIATYGITVGDQPSERINVFADWDARLDIFCQLYVLIVQLTHCNLSHHAKAGTLFAHRRQSDQPVANDLHSLHGVCGHNEKAGTLFT